MAARIPVNAATVKTYLDQMMTSVNYHLIYGLHLLPINRYKAILDALINGELQPEDLIRLGGFSTAEADILLNESLGAWTTPSVSIPATGTDGYIYLAETLGLSRIVLEATNAIPGILTSRSVLGAEVLIGLPNGNKNQNWVETIFRDMILPNAVAGHAIQNVIPSSEAEFRAISITGTHAAQDQAWLWFQSLFAPIIQVDNGYMLRRFISVGTIDSQLRSVPSFTEWLITGQRPALNTHILLQREASSRTVLGPYTHTDISNILDWCAALRPNYIGTGRQMSLLDLKMRIAKAAIDITLHSDTTLTARYTDMSIALEALYIQRSIIRTFIENILHGCTLNLLGNYPS